MYSFKNDYSEVADEKILQDLLEIATKQNSGYGCDDISAQAKALIAKRFQLKNTDIHFLTGGTQTNLVFLNSALRPIEAIIAADTGHISVHEAGAIEHNGNKIITVPNDDGKIRVKDIIKSYEGHIMDEHMVTPKLVFISLPTEKGTVYTKKELEEIYTACKKLNLYLYIDGARLGSALTCGNDIKPEDIGKLCDAFYIGGTKNGSPVGEALCIINDALKPNFRKYMKQHGALLAKGFLAGSCFKSLFEDDLFFRLAQHATKMAQKLAAGFVKKGYSMNSTSPTNQIFPIIPDAKVAELQKHFDFMHWEKLDKKRSVVRLTCSFATKETEVDKLINML